MAPWPYTTAAWRRLRRRQLARAPLCRHCRQHNRLTPADTVDHITPHKGDPALAFDGDTLQSLCARCHAGAKQSADRRGFDTRVGVDGWPLDPRHPANRGWGGRQNSTTDAPGSGAGVASRMPRNSNRGSNPPPR